MFEKAGGRSVIDYELVNWEAWKRVGRFEVGCRIESDHQLIIVEFGRWDRREEENLGKIEMVQDWSEEGTKEFCRKIEEVEWEKEGVGEGWKELETELKKAVSVRKRGKKRGIGWNPW